MSTVYEFDPEERMVACCSCPVTPNGLVSFSARNDLITNTLAAAIPTSIVIKLYASVPVAGSCANSAVSPGPGTSGMLAWGTTVHAAATTGTYFAAETPFVPATLSAGELSRMTQLFTFIVASGSGFGICRSCRAGSLGTSAAAK